MHAMVSWLESRFHFTSLLLFACTHAYMYTGVKEVQKGGLSTSPSPSELEIELVNSYTVQEIARNAGGGGGTQTAFSGLLASAIQAVEGVDVLQNFLVSVKDKVDGVRSSAQLEGSSAPSTTIAGEGDTDTMRAACPNFKLEESCVVMRLHSFFPTVY